ncbi:hypothetical protein PR048_000834 [Dryococelus australis]|uniref:CHK kinase-like domain-containing protein n=1 Tax=Dryococelus australis TaxID=614101 RepID=A0ABQ9IFU3_9NEOP|nr:hypothetical protein PR048_000834 [Dryococelus australis]
MSSGGSDNQVCPPSWADDRFMQEVLRKGENDPTIILKDVHFKKKNTNEEGFASEMFFFSLNFTREKRDHKIDDPRTAIESRSILLKNLPVGGKHQDYVCVSSSFPREMTMYSSIFPRLYKLLEKASGGTYQPFSPKFYVCQEQPVRALVLEDMSTEGYKLHPFHGFDLDHCKLILKKLAHFHGASAVLYEQDPTSMDTYSECLFTEDDLAREHWSEMFSGMARALAAAMRTWPEFDKGDADRLDRFADTLIDNLEKILKRDEKDFNVLNHGDLWVKNILFKYESGTGKPLDLRIIDFQNAHFSSPNVDLQYFLAVSPNDEVRFNHRALVIEEYHKELCWVLEHLGYSKKVPTLAELNDELDRKSWHGLFAAVTDLQILLSENFEFDSMRQDELQAKKEETHFSQSYRRIMHRLLPMYKEKGVL